MNRLLLVFLAAVLIAASACTRSSKADQQAALDNAYQAGLLTKEEYEAKKLALNGTPASTPPATPPVAPSPSAAAAPIRSKTAPSPSSPSTSPPTSSPTSTPTSAAHANETEAAALPGCETAELKSGGKKGAEERFFAAAPETVRRAAVSALGSLDFTIHKNSEKEIEASKKRHIGAIVGAGGERVILTFKEAERAGQSGTRVRGETKKSIVGHMAQKTWTDAVLAQIACKLGEAGP